MRPSLDQRDGLTNGREEIETQACEPILVPVGGFEQFFGRFGLEAIPPGSTVSEFSGRPLPYRVPRLTARFTS
jgi:hypothetical protein